MHHRLSTRDSGDLLVAEAHTLNSGAEITDVEGRFEHELGRGYSRGIVLDGVVLVQGMHTVTRNVVLQSEQDPASVELHIALQHSVQEDRRRAAIHLQERALSTEGVQACSAFLHVGKKIGQRCLVHRTGAVLRPSSRLANGCIHSFLRQYIASHCVRKSVRHP